MTCVEGKGGEHLAGPRQPWAGRARHQPRQSGVVTTQSLAVASRIQDDMESVIEIHKVMYIAHAMLPDLNISVEAVLVQGMSGFTKGEACQCIKICHNTS